jgi:cytochrome c oxidase subunit I+III
MAGPLLALPAAGRGRPRHLVTLGTLVIDAAGSLVFAALIAAYFALRGSTKVFPPQGVHLDEYLGVVATLTLILSAFLVEWSCAALRRGQRRQTLWALGLTIGMGAAFVNLEWYLVTRLGFGPASHPYGTLFYVMVVLAGVNAFVGILVLIGALARVLGGQISAAEPDRLRAAAWNWHFVVAAWTAVALTLYPIIR